MTKRPRTAKTGACPVCGRRCALRLGSDGVTLVLPVHFDQRTNFCHGGGRAPTPDTAEEPRNV